MANFSRSYITIFFLFTCIRFSLGITPDAVWRSMCYHRCIAKQVIEGEKPGCTKPIAQECYEPCFRPCNTSYSGKNFCKDFTCRSFTSNQGAICLSSCEFVHNVISMNLPYNQSFIDPLFANPHWNTEENLLSSLCNSNNAGAMKYIVKNLVIGNEPFRTKSNNEICTCSAKNSLTLPPNVGQYVVPPLKSSVDYKSGHLVLQVKFKPKGEWQELRYFLKNLNDDSGAVVSYCNITKSNVATAILHQPKDQIRYNIQQNNNGIEFMVLVVPSIPNLDATLSLANLTPAALEYLNPTTATAPTGNVSESDYATSGNHEEKNDYWKWLLASGLGGTLIAVSLIAICWNFRTKLITGEIAGRKLFQDRTGRCFEETFNELFSVERIQGISELKENKNFLLIIQCLDEQFSLISKALEKFLKKKEMKYTVSDEVDEGQLPIAYSMVKQTAEAGKIIIFLTKKLVETVEEYRENSRINYDNDDEKAMIIFFWITVLERLRKHKNSIDIILIKDSKLDSSIMVQNGNKILGLDDRPIYDIQSKKDQNQILNCLTHTTRGDKNWKISSAV